MRVVGLVALIADHAAGMLDGCHLGKAARLGGVLFVTAPAEVGDIGQLRNVRRGVVRVELERAMARFARYMRMLAGCARSGFGIVAYHAGGLARVCDWPLADQSQRTGAIVAILSEGLGDNRAAHHQEYGQAGQQNQGWPNQMTRIPYQSAHRPLLPRKPLVCASDDTMGH